MKRKENWDGENEERRALDLAVYNFVEDEHVEPEHIIIAFMRTLTKHHQWQQSQSPGGAQPSLLQIFELLVEAEFKRNTEVANANAASMSHEWFVHAHLAGDQERLLKLIRKCMNLIDAQPLKRAA